MSPALKLWINEKNRGYIFIIRRDPRDLSRIYVLHPKESHYIEVPYRTFSNPAVTLWEHKVAVKKLKDEGKKSIDEEAIFKSIQKMREIAKNAITKTKSARRTVTRLKHLESSSVNTDKGSLLVPPVDSLSTSKSRSIKLFDEIEEW
jgi:putative transposase